MASRADSAGPWWQGASVVSWLSVQHWHKVICQVYCSCRMRYISSSCCDTGTVICTFKGFCFEFYWLIFMENHWEKNGGKTMAFFGVCSTRSLEMMRWYYSHFVDLLHLIGKEWRGLPAQSAWNKVDLVVSENFEIETSPFSMAVRMFMQVLVLLL